MRLECFLAILLVLPMIDNLLVVKIHQNALYIPQSPCAHIRNVTLAFDASIQSCIWECSSVADCQTAVYYENSKICSMFSELNIADRIQPSGTIRASVICHRKNHSEIIPSRNLSDFVLSDPVPTCSTTSTTSSTTTSANSSKSFFS